MSEIKRILSMSLGAVMPPYLYYTAHKGLNILHGKDAFMAHDWAVSDLAKLTGPQIGRLYGVGPYYLREILQWLESLQLSPGMVIEELPTTSPASGLTKRELFAAMAMQGLCADKDCVNDFVQPEDLAGLAVERADALLEELKRDETP